MQVLKCPHAVSVDAAAPHFVYSVLKKILILSVEIFNLKGFIF